MRNQPVVLTFFEPRSLTRRSFRFLKKENPRTEDWLQQLPCRPVVVTTQSFALPSLDLWRHSTPALRVTFW